MLLIASKLHGISRNQNAILRNKAANLHSCGGHRATGFAVFWPFYFGAFYSQNGVSAKPRQWYHL
jgi:hypothetical protein